MAVETEGRDLDAIDEIQEVARSTNGKNQWSKFFPRSLQYHDGVTLEDVESLDHDGLLSLAHKLQELKTFEVTTEIFDPFKQLIQPKSEP